MDFELAYNSEEEGKKYLRKKLLDQFGVEYVPYVEGNTDAEAELDYRIAEKIIASGVNSFVVENIVRPEPNTLDQFNAGQHNYMKHIKDYVLKVKALAGKKSSVEYKF